MVNPILAIEHYFSWGNTWNTKVCTFPINFSWKQDKMNSSNLLSPDSDTSN